MFATRRAWINIAPIAWRHGARLGGYALPDCMGAGTRHWDPSLRAPAGPRE